MSSCFAKNPVRDIGPQLEIVFLRIVNHVLKAMYDAGFILHGAAVRDLLNGVCPRDFDFIRLDDITPAEVVKMLTCDGICADVIACESSTNTMGRRFCIGVQTGRTLLTSSPPVVLDIGVGIPFSPISYTSTEEVLAIMEPDYNVNMMYVESLRGEYAGESAHSARVLGNNIVADWAKIAIRSCERYYIDPAYVLQSVICKHALMMGCNGRSHAARGPIVAYRRMRALTSATYKDLTDYVCTEPHCCRSSAKTIHDELMQFINHESKSGEHRYRESIKRDAQDIVKMVCFIVADVPIDVTNVDTAVDIIKKHPLIKYRMVPRNLQTFPKVVYVNDRQKMLAHSAEIRELVRDTSVPRVKDQRLVDILKTAAEEVFRRGVTLHVSSLRDTACHSAARC